MRQEQSPSPQRPGLTLEYMLAKLERLQRELDSIQHYARTPTRHYGEHDPMQVPTVACEDCGATPRMRKAAGKTLRWVVTCPDCQKTGGPPQKRPWQAALAWNRINLRNGDYRELPLFGLARLTPAEAHQRLLGIRKDLELRKKRVGVKRRIAQLRGERPPGKTYQQRLDAYLQWAILAQSLVKLQRKEQHPASRETRS